MHLRLALITLSAIALAACAHQVDQHIGASRQGTVIVLPLPENPFAVSTPPAQAVANLQTSLACHFSARGGQVTRYENMIVTGQGIDDPEAGLTIIVNAAAAGSSALVKGVVVQQLIDRLETAAEHGGCEPGTT